MEQKKKHSEWVEAVKKWQEENEAARAIFVIATDKEANSCLFAGHKLALLNAVYQVIKQNPNAKKLIEDAQAIAKGGVAEELFANAFSEYAKENGIEVATGTPEEMLKALLGDLYDEDDE